MNAQEERESSEIMLACLLLQLGGTAHIDSVDSVSISVLLKTGLWRIEGGETPDGRFKLVLLNALGEPVDVNGYLAVREHAMKETSNDRTKAH